MMNNSKKAVLYRMATAEHTCPYGLRAKDLLNRKGYSVDDKILSDREQIDAIKQELGVKTTPQVVIDDERIGGFDDLQQFFGKTKTEGEKSYAPVIALFSIAALTSLAFNVAIFDSINIASLLMWFIGLSMIMLGFTKLQNIESFVNSFLGYDLLAKKYVPYAFIYPFAEVSAGLLMLSNLFPILSIVIMLFIGIIGGVSVFKAVYIDKRDLKCACVGGDSNVPLGFVSLLENGIMVGAALWTIFLLI